MKNVTNLDIKRQKLKLYKEATVFSVLDIYKESGYKNKLELLSVITVLSHTEKTYKDVINFLYKLEKVETLDELYSKLTKNELESKVLISKERLSISNSDTYQNRESLNQIPKKTNKKININSVFIFVMVICFLAVFLLVLTLDNKETKQKTPIDLVKENNKEILLKDFEGHKFVKININSISNYYLLDTGASSTLISVDFINELIKEGFITHSKNYLGSNYFQIADGTKVKGEVWSLPFVTIGEMKLENVEVVAIKNIQSSGFLLGMSTLKKLGDYTIVPNENKIIIN